MGRCCAFRRCRSNLNLLSWQSCTNKRCCKVATATQQIVYLAIGVAADKALCDVYLIALVLLHNGRQLLLDILRVGLGILVCAHKVESRQQANLHALLLKIVGHHVCAHYLALSHDVLLLKACEEVLGERAEIVELRSQELACALLVFVCRIKLLHMLHVLSLKIVDYVVGTIRVLLVEIV